MMRKVQVIFALLVAMALGTACGENSALTRFRKDMDDFCTRISEIDTSINNIDAQSQDAAAELLGYLDDLDTTFQTFAALDFPEEFDYLESLADESSQYMTEAVKSYHDAFRDHSYDEAIAGYARENYSRAYKRVQIIISFLHGEEPLDPDLSAEYENN